MNSTPFILVTQDNEYFANCQTPKLTLNMSEARVYMTRDQDEGRLAKMRAQIKQLAEWQLDRIFYVADVELDSDDRAVRRLP